MKEDEHKVFFTAKGLSEQITWKSCKAQLNCEQAHLDGSVLMSLTNAVCTFPLASPQKNYYTSPRQKKKDEIIVCMIRL